MSDECKQGKNIHKRIEVGIRMLKLEIIKQHNSYIVRRTDGEYNQHAHVSTMKGCKLLIECINKNKLPKSKYLIGSCKRLLTDDEYNRLRKPKDYYYNVNKGVRKT